MMLLKEVLSHNTYLEKLDFGKQNKGSTTDKLKEEIEMNKKIQEFEKLNHCEMTPEERVIRK